MIYKLQSKKGIAGIYIVIGGLFLLAMGAVIGSMFSSGMKNQPEVIVSVSPTATPTSIPEEESMGSIEGELIYPSEGIPADVGVCAELLENTNIKTCVQQTKDKKYKTGVGFKIDVTPGVYYVYATKEQQRAYYNQFVICGLKYECKDRTKIPVIVKAGAVSEAMPHDWYDTTTPTPSPKITLKPTIKLPISN